MCQKKALSFTPILIKSTNKLKIYTKSKDEMLKGSIYITEVYFCINQKLYDRRWSINVKMFLKVDPMLLDTYLRAFS